MGGKHRRSGAAELVADTGVPELATRLRDSEAVARASQRADRAGARSAVVAESASARAAELGGVAANKVAQLGTAAAAKADQLGEATATKAAELGGLAAVAAAQTRGRAEQASERVGDWVATSGVGERLGMEPPKRRRRAPRLLLLVALAGGVAFLISKLRTPSQPELDDDPFAAAADRLAYSAPPRPSAPAGEPPAPPSTTQPPTTPQPTTTAPTSTAIRERAEVPASAPVLPDAPAPAQVSEVGPMPQPPPAPTSHEPGPPGTVDIAPNTSGRPLAEQVRTRLDDDHRTSGLTGLAINVAEGTVFVRGSVPSGFDPEAIREIIAGTPGVTDVDLQVSASA